MAATHSIPVIHVESGTPMRINGGDFKETEHKKVTEKEFIELTRPRKVKKVVEVEEGAPPVDTDPEPDEDVVTEADDSDDGETKTKKKSKK